MKKFIKLFKRLFCNHKYLPVGSYMDTNEQGHYIKKHIWYCSKCSKELWGDKKCKRPV